MSLGPETLPRKSLIRRIGKWGGLLACILLFIGFLGLFVEQSRAKRVWEKFRSEWEAKGEVFELAPLFETKMADEANYARADIFLDPTFGPELRELVASLSTLKGTEGHGWNLQKHWLSDQRIEGIQLEAEIDKGAERIAEWKNNLDRVAEAAQRPTALFFEFEEVYMGTKSYVKVQQDLGEVFFIRAMLALGEGRSSSALIDGATLSRIGLHLEKNGRSLDYLVGGQVRMHLIQ
ncbi:MAG: hypothetical protein AAF514_20210, partial [Verrucomicrobiota bacterium]